MRGSLLSSNYYLYLQALVRLYLKCTGEGRANTGCILVSYCNRKKKISQARVRNKYQLQHISLFSSLDFRVGGPNSLTTLVGFAFAPAARAALRRGRSVPRGQTQHGACAWARLLLPALGRG